VRQDWLQEVEDRVWWQEQQNTVQNFLSSIKSGEFLHEASNHQLVRRPVVHVINTFTVIRQPRKEWTRIDPLNTSLYFMLLWVSSSQLASEFKTDAATAPGSGPAESDPNKRDDMKR
jgi:hypothetical protein